MAQAVGKSRPRRNVSPGGVTERMWPQRMMFVMSLLSATLLGCKKESTTSAPTARPAATERLAGRGTIHGRVTFEGTRPQMPEIAMTADPRCGNHPAVKQESVV